MNVIAKLFCALCIMLCAACESGTTGGKDNNNDQEENVNKNNPPYTKTIGNGNYYNIHNFMGENPTFVGKDGLTGSATVVKNVNYYLNQASTYAKDLANKFEQSLNGRPAAQNYFSKIINAMQTNDSFHIDEVNPGSQKFDLAVMRNAKPCEPVFADIIKNLSNADERDQFELCYRVLAAEASKEGLGNYRNVSSPLMDSYETEKNYLIKWWPNDKTNINLANIYEQNNSLSYLKKFNPITDLTNQLLTKAVKKMNDKQNLGLQVSDMQQFINITLTSYSLGAMHGYTSNALQHKGINCVMGLNYVNTMEKAAKEANKEDQQYQQAYQDYLSR